MTKWRIEYEITLPEGTLSNYYIHTFHIRPYDWHHVFKLISGYLAMEYKVRRTAATIRINKMVRQ